MNRILSLIFLLSLFSAHPSLAEQRKLILKNSKIFYEVGPFLDILEDPTGKLTINDVISPQYNSLFKTNTQKVPNFGFSPSAHWARFYLKNLPESKKEWLLSFNYYNQDEVIFYKKENSKWESIKTGDLYPVSSREIKERPFLFKLNSKYPGPYFVRIKGSDNQLDLTLGTSIELGSRESIENYLLGLFFGLSFAMAAFNLFVYFTTRSPAHLYYVLYVISAGLFLGNDFGYVLRYLTPNTPWFSNNGQALFAGLFQIFFLKFVISFLKLKETTPNLYLANNFFVYTSFGLIISSFILPFSFNVLYLSINPLMFFFLIIFTGVYRIKMNYRPAKYFITAFMFTLLGAIILILVVAGVLPSTAILRKALVIGHGIDLILLSMGLADKFNLIQEESLNHAKNAKGIQEQMTKHLEEEVKKQTKKLKVQNEELKLMDERKTNFFQNISHELRTPLTLIMSPLEYELQEHPENEHVQMAAKSTRRLHQLVNQLLDIQKITAGKQKLTLEPIDINLFLKNCYEMFQDKCKRMEVQFNLSFEGNHIEVKYFTKVPLLISGNTDALEKVIINFLSNALKHSPRNSTLILDLSIRDQKACISVIDQGRGIHDTNLKAIFEPFHQIEQGELKSIEGSGLGLALAKELTYLMKGDLGVKSQMGSGSCFWCEFNIIKEKENLILILENNENWYHFNEYTTDKKIGPLFKLFLDPEKALKYLIDNKNINTIAIKYSILKKSPVIMEQIKNIRKNLKVFIIYSTKNESKESPPDYFEYEELNYEMGFDFFLKKIKGFTQINDPYFDKEETTKKELFPNQHWFIDDHVKEKSRDELDKEISDIQRNDNQIEKPPLILIVDDILDMRNIISKPLTKHGFRSIGVSNGFDGLSTAKKIKPDLIITDWMMPILNGIEMIKFLRNESSTKYIPIILLTAKNEEESKLIGQEKGADAFLGKPFSENELMSIVKNLIHLKKKEKEVIKLNNHITNNILKRYLPPQLVDQILSNKIKIQEEPKKIPGTILFSDIVKFTSLTSQLRSSKIARILKQIFSEMSDIIFKHNGTIDKFIGDSIMVIFGAPVYIGPEQQAINAQRCAIDMQLKIEELNKQWLKEGIPEISMRIGIHFGPLIVGNFGSEKRVDYTAIGQTVNLANQIQSLCTPKEIFISGEVFDYLDESAAIEIGKFELEGLGKSIPLYKILFERKIIDKAS